MSGFWSGNGHVTIYSNEMQVKSGASNKTKLKWKSRLQVTQKERAPLQRIQFHSQRGRIFEVWKKTGNFKHELQFNTQADILAPAVRSKKCFALRRIWSFEEGPRSKRSAIRAPLEKGLIIHLTQSKIQGMRPFHEGAFSKADLRRASSRHQKYRCFEKGAEKNGCF